MNSKLLKVLGYAVTVGGIILGLVTDYVDDKKLDEKIDKKFDEKMASMNNEGEESC